MKIIAMLLVCCILLGWVACSAQEAPETTVAPETTAAPVQTEAAIEAKPVLLAVSFGSSFNETREATLMPSRPICRQLTPSAKSDALLPARSLLTFWKSGKTWKLITSPRLWIA